MRKPVPAGILTALTFILSIGAAPLTGQTREGDEPEPLVAPRGFEAAAAAETPRCWKRGDVLMPRVPLLLKMGEHHGRPVISRTESVG